MTKDNTEEENKAKLNLDNKLVAFDRAWQDLLEAWTSIEVGFEANFPKEYPFERSFDEYDVSGWVEAFRKILKQNDS